VDLGFHRTSVSPYCTHITNFSESDEFLAAGLLKEVVKTYVFKVFFTKKNLKTSKSKFRS